MGRVDADTYELLPDARRFEPFEGSLPTRVGLGVAADYALSWGIDAIAARVVVTEAVRASIHYYNTEDELGRLVDVVKSLN